MAYEWFCAVCGNFNIMPKEGGTFPVECGHEPDDERMYVTKVVREPLGSVRDLVGTDYTWRRAS